MLNIIVNGCHGKMGQVLVKQIEHDDELNIVAGIDTEPEKIKMSFPVYKNIFVLKEKAHIVIDFSSPKAINDLLDYGIKTNTPLVIATTGMSPEDMDNIKNASRSIPIFYSSNMSVGINIILALVQMAAKTIGDSADIEIIEKHHNLKVDAPSGTAYSIADKINEALNHSKEYVFGRHSYTEKRKENEIGIHAIRGGTIVGEHSVIFASKDETIEISHSASSKNIFALGAIRAAKFLIGKAPGFYSMRDLMDN